jgi:hypothetical protein
MDYSTRREVYRIHAHQRLQSPQIRFTKQTYM